MPTGELSPEQRRVALRCLWIVGALGAGTLLGVASSLYLVNNAPLLLIALSPLGRHLVLVAPVVNPYAFLAVAVTRRSASSITWFFLGRATGPVAVQWVEGRSPTFGRAFRWLERLFWRFEKGAFVLVFLMPGPALSAIAGDARMHTGVYLPMVIAGLSLRMAIVLWIGDALRGPIEVALGWIREYWLPGTVVLIVAMALHRHRVRARSAGKRETAR